jgi:hypothetical protein
MESAAEGEGRPGSVDFVGREEICGRGGEGNRVRRRESRSDAVQHVQNERKK